MSDQSKSLQDIMSGDIFASNSRPELVETLKFMEGHGTPLSEYQVQGMAFLKVLQAKRGHKAFEPVMEMITKRAKDLTPSKTFMDVINSYFTGNLVDKRMINNNLKASK